MCVGCGPQLDALDTIIFFLNYATAERLDLAYQQFGVLNAARSNVQVAVAARSSLRVRWSLISSWMVVVHRLMSDCMPGSSTRRVRSSFIFKIHGEPDNAWYIALGLVIG